MEKGEMDQARGLSLQIPSLVTPAPHIVIPEPHIVIPAQAGIQFFKISDPQPSPHNGHKVIVIACN